MKTGQTTLSLILGILILRATAAVDRAVCPLFKNHYKDEYAYAPGV